MQQKKLIQNYKNFLPLLLLGIFSFLINYHYGFIGIMPLDNTVLYNGGYRVLNGYIPFSDYWLVTGPLLDYLQSAFFLIFDVNWFSHVIHAAFINIGLAIFIFYFFNKIKLNQNLSLIYAIAISILAYPSIGTPFVDHHAVIFCLFSICCFIIGINQGGQTRGLDIPQAVFSPIVIARPFQPRAETLY